MHYVTKMGLCDRAARAAGRSQDAFTAQSMEPSDDEEEATRGGASASPAGVGGAKLRVDGGGVTVSESVLDDAGSASPVFRDESAPRSDSRRHASQALRAAFLRSLVLAKAW